MCHRRPLRHGGLIGDVMRSLGRGMRGQLVRDMLHGGRRVMVWRERVIRSLAHHAVSTVGVRLLSHWRSVWISGIAHVVRHELRAALLRRHVIVRPRRRRHRSHAVTRDERLCLWVEGMPIEAARDRVLALRVMGINVGRKSAISVGDS